MATRPGLLEASIPTHWFINLVPDQSQVAEVSGICYADGPD